MKIMIMVLFSFQTACNIIISTQQIRDERKIIIIYNLMNYKSFAIQYYEICKENIDYKHIIS